MTKSPAIPLEELARRYEALGPLEDWAGERTFVSRCLSFQSFLDYGPAVAHDLRREVRAWGTEQALAPNPALGALILSAWPSN